jgi:hypothetical protein
VTDTDDTQNPTPFLRKKASDYDFVDTMLVTAATALVMSAVPLVVAVSAQKIKSVVHNRKMAKVLESTDLPETPES